MPDMERYLDMLDEIAEDFPEVEEEVGALQMGLEEAGGLADEEEGPLEDELSLDEEEMLLDEDEEEDVEPLEDDVEDEEEMLL